jgi:hypothetical protein
VSAVTGCGGAAAVAAAYRIRRLFSPALRSAFSCLRRFSRARRSSAICSELA